jgi:DNA-binding LacI/PurR family transcriptional regulator
MNRVAVLKSKVTSVDVARLAGVAHATVSRVINNPAIVTPNTREKVLNAIRVTGYKPSSSARMLVRRTYETIGLIFEKEHLNTFHGARLIEGVTEKLSESGHRLAMGMIKWRTPAVQIEQLPLLRTHSVDGLILDVAQIAGDLDVVVSRLGLPYVYINPSGGRPYNTIKPDDGAAASLATQYLIDHGHRRIGYIPCYSNQTHGSQEDRMKGYVDTLLRANLQPIPLWDRPIEKIYVDGDDDYTQRLRIFHDQYGCTGIVNYTSGEALRMLFACYRLGLKVPEDIALIGCDFSPSITDAPVSIPTIHLDRMKMGQMAVDMLLERIRNPNRDIPSVFFKGILVEDPRDWYGARGFRLNEA